MSKKIKYFIQIDTGCFDYQSDLIRISKKAFEIEYDNCMRLLESNNRTTTNNMRDYLGYGNTIEVKDCYDSVKKEIIELEKMIITEYRFDYTALIVYLQKVECKKGYRFKTMKEIHSTGCLKYNVIYHINQTEYKEKQFNSRKKAYEFYKECKFKNSYGVYITHTGDELGIIEEK